MNHSHETIFDLAPFPMWIYNLKTFRFLAVNRQAIHQYGYTHEEFLNMTIKEIRPLEEIPKLEKAVVKARNRTEAYKQSLHRHQRKNGSIIYVKIKSNLINYNNTQAEIVTAIDLTDRYQQEKLIRKQKKYLAIIGHLNQILLTSNHWAEALNQCFHLVGNTLKVNRIYFFQNNIYEQTTSQKIEWVKDKLQPQIDNPKLQNIPLNKFTVFMGPLYNGKSFEAIISELSPSPTKDLLTKQGVKSTLVLPVMINKVFIGFIGIDDCKKEKKWNESELQLLKNLTSNLGHLIKEEQAYQKLVDSEAKFKSLLLNSSDLVGIVDDQGYYRYVAPNSTSVLGITPEEFIGKNAFDFIHTEDIPRIRKCQEQILKKKQITIEPYRFLDTKGNWLWIETELTNHLANPAIKGIVANSWNVTPQVEKRNADELLTLMTNQIGRPGLLPHCLTMALKQLIKHSESSASEIWLISNDKQHLNLVSKSFDDKKFKDFYEHEDVTNINSFNKGQGLPGYIWNTKKTRTWLTLATNSQFVRKKAAELIQLKAAIGIPIFYNTEFIGCFITFYLQIQPNHSHQRLLTKVGTQIGAVIKQKITEEEYRNFFDISPDPLCVVGFDGLIKKHNNALRKLLGYKKNELLNKSIFNYIYKEDRVESKRRLETSIQSNKSKSFEIRFVSKNKEIKWLVWSGVTIVEAKILFAVAKDITEQKIAKQELETAYQRLKTAQKIAKLGYWVRNFDSEVSVWSEEAYKIHGYTPKNFTPTMENVTKTFHPEDRHLIKRSPTNNLKPGKVESFEHRILTASGEVRWVRQEVHLVADAKGIPYRIQGTIQDITESKEHEQKLAISNERFRLAVQASNEMIWEINHLNKKITRSKVYKKIFNYHLDEIFLKNTSWFNKIHPEDRDDVWNSFQQAHQNKKETFWHKEYRIFSDDGSISYFIDRCFILRDKNGIPLQSVGSALDISASKKQLEKIKQQNNNLREIGWLQSHVIRAPLARIMSVINFYKEFGTEEISMEEFLDIIINSANELDKVIHEITQKTNTIMRHDDKKNFTN